jgi:plasmid stability protein
MGELTIRDIDEPTLQQIAHLAGLHARSLEEEVLNLIRQALGSQRDLTWETAARIAAITPNGVSQTDSVELLREDRNQ